MVGPTIEEDRQDGLLTSKEVSKERQARLELILAIPWIRKCGSVFASYLLSVGEDRTFHSGHAFLLDRQTASSFYILLDGSVSITVEMEGRQV